MAQMYRVRIKPYNRQRGYKVRTLSYRGKCWKEYRRIAQYDAAADTLKVYLVATGAEIANGVDLSSTNFTMDYTSQ